MRESKDDERVVHFMRLFSKLREMIDDEPNGLEALAAQDEPLKQLCVDTGDAAVALSLAQASHRQLFAAPVDPAFIAAWRAYEDRYAAPLAHIQLCDLLDIPSDSELRVGEDRALDEFRRREEWAALEAREQAGTIMTALDFAAEQIEWEGIPEDTVERVEEGIRNWSALINEVGLDLEGVLRRRALVPFVLIPRDVSRHHGSQEKLSLLTHLQQAHNAFVFGAPFASLALMRSILEVVLRMHYGSSGGELSELIENARSLPAAANKGRLHRLRKLANHVLHFDRDRVQLPSDIERALVVHLLVLRALIEAAPTRRIGA